MFVYAYVHIIIHTYIYFDELFIRYSPQGPSHNRIDTTGLRVFLGMAVATMMVALLLAG